MFVKGGKTVATDDSGVPTGVPRARTGSRYIVGEFVKGIPEMAPEEFVAQFLIRI